MFSPTTTMIMLAGYIAFITAALLATVTTIGKPRPPTTGGVVALLIVIQGAALLAMASAVIHLSRMDA